MPSAVPGHRSSPSIDKLLDQLDENEVHILLAELNNSPDVHIPVAEAIDFYEKPRRHRYGHGLPAKRAVSSPCLASARRRQQRNNSPPPPVPTIPPAMTIPSAREPCSSPVHKVSDKYINADTIVTNNKRVSSLPLLNGIQDFQRPQTAERDAEPSICANAASQITTPRIRRAYKRISRPPQLAEYLFKSSDMAVSATRRLPSLSSARSMLDLRMLNQHQENEDDHRPTDVLEPMVLNAWSPGVNIPLVLGNSRLTHAPSMDSLFGVLAAGNNDRRPEMVYGEPAKSSDVPVTLPSSLHIECTSF